MTKSRGRAPALMLALAMVAGTGLVGGVTGAAAESPHSADDVAAYWTPARKNAAVPLDLVVDSRGLAYQQRPDGSLVPHGHAIPNQVTQVGRQVPTPQAKPGGGVPGDTTSPGISNLSPADGATIGSSATFSATVTDASGLRSVAVVITSPTGSTQSFAAAPSGTNVWSTTLQGFTDGAWSWKVIAKDKVGNTTTSPANNLTVDTSGTGGGGGGGSNVITNAVWTGSAVSKAVGRIYFEMPANSRGTRWNGYVCSGSVATDEAVGQSVIITAAHCVYDDVNKAFARNVLFIPNQADGGDATDRVCTNDPLGCWTPSYGVVDLNWTTRTFPDNVAWDYAYYVVPTGAHTGSGGGADLALETAAGTLNVSFTPPAVDIPESASDYTHAIGYSYSEDPKLMYCAEDLTTEGTVNWWLPNCGLSGGSSGGAWIQPMSGETGPIISVNSWGYTTSPGMAGPKLAGTSAECVFDVSQGSALGATVDITKPRGTVVLSCPAP